MICQATATRFLVTSLFLHFSVVEAEEPKVANLISSADRIEIQLNDDAPKTAFRKGPCIIIRGLLPPIDENEMLVADSYIKQQSVADKTEVSSNLKWEPVDLNVAHERLIHVSALEHGVAPKNHFHPATTMPLPKRVENVMQGLPTFATPSSER